MAARRTPTPVAEVEETPSCPTYPSHRSSHPHPTISTTSATIGSPNRAAMPAPTPVMSPNAARIPMGIGRIVEMGKRSFVPSIVWLVWRWSCIWRSRQRRGVSFTRVRMWMITLMMMGVLTAMMMSSWRERLRCTNRHRISNRFVRRRHCKLLRDLIAVPRRASLLGAAIRKNTDVMSMIICIASYTKNLARWWKRVGGEVVMPLRVVV
mmetsp:Transcript_30709/g.64734  ORF Transcript_30709/g.64734 Transcript_30709/m.64734 type:complete len:209 (-) Transcript_30709:4172-4798(-)